MAPTDSHGEAVQPWISGDLVDGSSSSRVLRVGPFACAEDVHLFAGSVLRQRHHPDLIIVMVDDGQNASAVLAACTLWGFTVGAAETPL